MKVNRDHMSIVTDELGLKDFSYTFYQDFYGCLDEFIKYSGSLGVNRLSSIIGFDDYESSVRLKCLFDYIYSNINDSKVKNIFSDYGRRLCLLDDESILEVIRVGLMNYFSSGLKRKFSSEMSPYIEFSKRVTSEFDKLRSNFDYYDRKVDERLLQLKEEFVSGDYDDFVDGDVKFNDYYSKMEDASERVEALSDCFAEMMRELKSYLSLEEEFVSDSLNELVSCKTMEIYNSKCIINKFEMIDYILLINGIRGFSKEIPIPTQIVIGEIERIAYEDGIVLNFVKKKKKA